MQKTGGGRLLLAVVALHAVAVCLGCLDRYGIDGGSVTLEPEENAGADQVEISWKKGNNLVAEWGNEPWIAPVLKGRAELDSTKGSLILSNLQRNDSGQYTAEVVVGSKLQNVDFCLQILARPKPPWLNCTADGDQIRLSCEPDTLHLPANISLTYEWKYQKSNKQIPGNSPKIWLAKDVDSSENITCIISFLNANSSSSLSLRDCSTTGASLQRRNWAWLAAPFVAIAIAGMAFYRWKKGSFNFKCKGKSPEGEGRTDVAEAPSEEVRLN